jgi:hypothetical protein
MSMARTRADVRGKTMSPPCNCRLHACKRSCLRSASVFGLSNARVFAGAPLSVPARPCICFFFSPGEHFRGKFQAVFCFFEGRSRARQTPAASTNASRHAGEIGGHGVDMPWSPYRKIKPTRPQHGNERPRTWVSRWTCMQCTAHTHIRWFWRRTRVSVQTAYVYFL